MARGKCRQGKAGGMAPAAGMLMEVRRLLDEGAFRASRAQRFCTGAADCCRFRLTGETPHVTLGEAWVAWKAWRASGRTRLELPPDGSCPFLSGQGRCMIYEGRPLACRTHFCVPAGGALPRRCNAPRHLIELRQVSYITCLSANSVQGVCIDSASPLQATSRSPQSTASSSSLAIPSWSILSLASASRCITLARSLAG